MHVRQNEEVSFDAFIHVHVGFADCILQVTGFQQSRLRALGVPNPAVAPQALLAASEQGWPTDNAADSGVKAAAQVWGPVFLHSRVPLLCFVKPQPQGLC